MAQLCGRNLDTGRAGIMLQDDRWRFRSRNGRFDCFHGCRGLSAGRQKPRMSPQCKPHSTPTGGCRGSDRSRLAWPERFEASQLRGPRMACLAACWFEASLKPCSGRLWPFTHHPKAKEALLVCFPTECLCELSLMRCQSRQSRIHKACTRGFRMRFTRFLFNDKTMNAMECGEIRFT